MRKIHLYSLLSLASLLLLWACQKTLPEDILQEENNSQAKSTRLSYGDTIFYLKTTPGNYTVLPVSKPSAPGKFKCLPLGLVLDSVTGLINVTQSEAGMRYKVFYIGANGAALDSVKLVISGIDYKDAIYEIASTPNAYDTAFPIYNARPQILLPCGDDDEDDDGDLDDDDNQCVFDETDLNDDGNDDIPGVIQDKLLVDIKKGTIDVEASFNAGIFGSSNPANGISKDFTMYYRLQDLSNRALNKITVRVYHFRKRSDIPQALLDTINIRNQIASAVNSRTASTANNAGGSSISGISEELNTGARLTSYDLYGGTPRRKRPPIIIIVSR
jgi:hypothetical protein